MLSELIVQTTAMSQLIGTYCTFQTEMYDVYKAHVSSAQHIDTLCALPKDTSLQCMICNKYSTKHKNNFRRHMATCAIGKVEVSLDCKLCHKHFETRSGLYKHTLKCKIIHENPVPCETAAVHPEPINDINLKQQVESLVEEKQTELATVISGAIQPLVDRLQALEEAHTLEQRLIDELKATIINNPTNVTNVTNNTMNINMFLNDYCKNAMNIMDFIKAIQIKHSDIDQFGKKCYVEAMTGLMTSELHKLPLNQRPLHCTDHRRQTLHVKHENTWHKEEKGTPILITAIIGLRMACQKVTLDRFKDRGMPEAYKIIKQVTGGRNTQDQAVYDRRNSKIVSKICQAVKLDRNDMKVRDH
jgi:hypothetical protein